MVMVPAVPHRASADGQHDRQHRRNVEIEQFTQALYDARELAMSRMQAEAEELHAEASWGSAPPAQPHLGTHTTEFFAIGTAVRPLRPITSSTVRPWCSA